jgi:cell wall-associated NlpC family hydrolase
MVGGLASSAEARTKAGGGAQAPQSSTGGTGITGSTSSTGTTGSTDPTAPLAALAPIVLGRHQSPYAVYGGPVFEVTPAGLVPYTPPGTTPTTNDTPVAGGTNAATSAVDPARNDLPDLEVPGSTAQEVKIDGLGLAAAPENAPAAVQEVIWTANRIIGLPYLWGGGHQKWNSPGGYDCSGTVSYALHGGALLNTPLDSGQFESWGLPGQGEWMTILTNAGHAYLDIAGLRLDTSPANDPSGLEGPRWRPLRPNNSGFMKRHPVGF